MQDAIGFRSSASMRRERPRTFRLQDKTVTFDLEIPVEVRVTNRPTPPPPPEAHKPCGSPAIGKGRGIWGMDFVDPESWRHSQMRRLALGAAGRAGIERG